MATKSECKRLSEAQVYDRAFKIAQNVAPRYGINTLELAKVTTALARIESNYCPTAKNPKSSARGMMQILIGTQKEIETKFLKTSHQPEKIWDVSYSILLAETYLAYQYKRYKNWYKAMWAYNQGSFSAKTKNGKKYADVATKALQNQTVGGNLAVNAVDNFFKEFL